MIRKILVYILILTLPTTGFANAAGPIGTQETLLETSTGELIARIDHFAASIEKVRSHIDRSQFDLDALLEKLDFEADKIINFVKEEIYFEQYPGLLRGARGTLMSRAGNALDQSVLLANLLKNAGFEARIAQSKISENQARNLIGTISGKKLRIDPLTDVKAVESTFRSLIAPLGLEEEMQKAQFDALVSPGWSFDTDLLSSASDTARLLHKAVLAIKPGLKPSIVEAELTTEALDYFWVQYRNGPATPWQDAHPAFSLTNSTGCCPNKAQRIFRESIPSKLQHRLRIEILLEVRRGTAFELLPLMKPWERPVANISTEAITFSNLPTDASSFFDCALSKKENDRQESSVPCIEAESEGRMFVPMLNGSIPAGGLAFDLAGNLIDPLTAGSAATGVFQTLNRKVGTSISEFGGDSGSVPVTTGQIIRLSTISPGGNITSYDDRYIFKRLPYSSQENEQHGPILTKGFLPNPLMDISIGVVSHDLPKAFVLDLYLHQFAVAGPLAKTILGLPFDASIESDSGKDNLARALSATNSLVTRLEMASFFKTFGAPFENQGVSFLHVPNIVMMTSKLETGIETTVTRMVDIMENNRRVIDASGQVLMTAPRKALLTGSWQTWAEGALLEPSSGSESITPNLTIARSFRSSSSLNGLTADEVVTLSKLSDLSLLPDNIPIESRMAIARDLEKGFIVVTPPAGKLKATYGWWRIDPVTGTCLGQGFDGRGNLYEDIIMRIGSIDIAFIVSRFVQGFLTYSVCYFVKAVKERAIKGTRPGKALANKVFVDCLGHFAAGVLFGVKMEPKTLGTALAKILTAAFVAALE